METLTDKDLIVLAKLILESPRVVSSAGAVVTDAMVHRVNATRLAAARYVDLRNESSRYVGTGRLLHKRAHLTDAGRDAFCRHIGDGDPVFAARALLKLP